MIIHTIPASEDAPRLDRWLAEQSDMSRTAVQKLIEDGRVTLNDKPVKASQAVFVGDVFVIREEIVKTMPQAEDITLDIVYEDADILVLNKPKGMVVHPAAGVRDHTLVNALLSYCDDDLSDVQGEDRRGIVHRLDKDTTGLMIVAKNNEAHRSIASQLEKRTLKRYYQAVVWGKLEAASSVIDAPVGRDPNHRQRMAVISSGKPAITKIDVIEQALRGAHLRCELISGRTHQIRVHLSYIGHPIVGDTLYGMKWPGIFSKGQLLHAYCLEFVHPRTGETINLTSKLPADFASAMEYMRGEG